MLHTPRRHPLRVAARGYHQPRTLLAAISPESQPRVVIPPSTLNYVALVAGCSAAAFIVAHVQGVGLPTAAALGVAAYTTAHEYFKFETRGKKLEDDYKELRKEIKHDYKVLRNEIKDVLVEQRRGAMFYLAATVLTSGLTVAAAGGFAYGAGKSRHN